MPKNGEANKEEVSSEVHKQKKLGGLRTMPFILANEVCDRFAATGFQANMITYLTQQLNLPLVMASNLLTNFKGTAGFATLLGGMVADSFAGRYWTIIFGAIIYVLGMTSVTVSAALPTLQPPRCPSKVNCQQASSLQMGILYLSLLLISIGLGGTKPCVVTFAADQIDMSKSKINASKKKWNFFNAYYFCMGLATVTALTVVVYIQDQVSWGWGLGIPTIIMALSVVSFIIGSPLYKKAKLTGSPLVRLAQVVVASIKKRNAIAPLDHNSLYENEALDADISLDGKLLHTNHMSWLDRAAIKQEGDTKGDSKIPNLWRLSTIHRIEELKSILRILPVWSTTILFVMAYSHQQSFTIIQAGTMKRHLFSSSFEIPPASMSVFNAITILVCCYLYDHYFIPFSRRYTKNPTGITSLQRMGFGFIVNILATTSAALVETKRKNLAKEYNLLDKPNETIPISIFWLVPQYSLHGIADVFLDVGHLEFLYDQAPESMRSMVMALHYMSIASGNYLGTFMVSIVNKYTLWLPDRNINSGKLNYYYWLVTATQGMNLIYYFVCAYLYTYKPLEDAKRNGEPKDVELASENIQSREVVDVVRCIEVMEITGTDVP